MFFILSKLLTFLLSPTFWIIAVFVFALSTKNKLYKKRGFIVSIILLTFFTNPLIFNISIKAWEAEPKKPDQLSPHYNYVVALGGMAGYLEKYEKVVFHESVERLLHAVHIMQNGTADKLVISGGAATIFVKRKKEAEVLRDYLVEIGIDKNKVLIESESKNTFQNARNTVQLLKSVDSSFNTCSILLVTSAMHIKRAKACFKKQGVIVDVYPVHHYGEYGKLDNPLVLIAPNLSLLNDWSMLFKEIVGFWVYRMRGYL